MIYASRRDAKIKKDAWGSLPTMKNYFLCTGIITGLISMAEMLSNNSQVLQIDFCVSRDAKSKTHSIPLVGHCGSMITAGMCPGSFTDHNYGFWPSSCTVCMHFDFCVSSVTHKSWDLAGKTAAPEISLQGYLSTNLEATFSRWFSQGSRGSGCVPSIFHFWQKCDAKIGKLVR